MTFNVNEEDLKQVVESEQNTYVKEKLKRFDKLFKALKKFMKLKKIILYGGTAINLHLPTASKIYTENDFPDFDCFSTNPQKDAEELAHIISKLDYKYIEVKFAMHSGTYKLYTEFQPICDFTRISKDNHALLLKKSSFIDGFYVTNIQHLKSASYLELAIPKAALFRWEKVIIRTKLLETVFMNNRSSFTKQKLQYVSFDTKINDILTKFKSYAIQQGLVLCGNACIQHHIKEVPKENNYVLTNSSGVFQCISSNMSSTVNHYKKMLQKSKFKNISLQVEKYDLITPYTKIHITYYDDQYTFEHIKLNICTVYSADDHCYSYNKSRGVKYASVFFMLHMLYFSLYSMNDEIDRVNIKNVINMLMKNININSFKTECYGTEMTLHEMKKHKWDHKKPSVLLRID